MKDLDIQSLAAFLVGAGSGLAMMFATDDMQGEGLTLLLSTLGFGGLTGNRALRKGRGQNYSFSDTSLGASKPPRNF